MDQQPVRVFPTLRQLQAISNALGPLVTNDEAYERACDWAESEIEKIEALANA